MIRSKLKSMNALIGDPMQVNTSSDPDVLNASEAALFLGSHVETLRRLARRGEIPSFKLGKDWRFHRDSLLRWIDKPKFGKSIPTVLIVDDDIIVCRVLGREVESFGCRVSFATSGQEGLELVSSWRPDMILLDLMMPHMNGPEFLRELHAVNPDIPVVIITGYPDSELMCQALQFGPFMVLSKPIAMIQLERAIRIALGGSVVRKAG